MSESFEESFQKALVAARASGKKMVSIHQERPDTKNEIIDLVPEKVTIYSQKGGGPYHAWEASSYSFRRREWAQYRKAVEVHFVPRGARKDRQFVDTHSPLTFLILKGWGHPSGPPTSINIPGSPGIQVSRWKYLNTDPRWSKDFDQFIEQYIKASGAKVIVDYRGQSPY
jgi:hypothetical protein